MKAGGSGDVTKTHRLWHHPRNPQRIGSGVIVGEHAFHVNEPGLAPCFELKTGKDLWNQERLTGKTWGSPVHADGKVYMTNCNGETLVFKPNPTRSKCWRGTNCRTPCWRRSRSPTATSSSAGTSTCGASPNRPLRLSVVFRTGTMA